MKLIFDYNLLYRIGITNTTTMCVYSLLKKYCIKGDPFTYISNQTISNCLYIKERTVQEALRTLKKFNCIKVLNKDGKRLIYPIADKVQFKHLTSDDENSNTLCKVEEQNLLNRLCEFEAEFHRTHFFKEYNIYNVLKENGFDNVPKHILERFIDIIGYTDRIWDSKKQNFFDFNSRSFIKSYFR